MKSSMRVKLRPDLVAQFEALPDRSSNGGKPWTPEADAAILRFYGKKKRGEFLKLFAAKFFSVGKSCIKERINKLRAGTVTRAS